MEKEFHTHPSFGQIEIARVHSTGTDFYGSELTQADYISITIHSSEMSRDLTRDWYFQRSPLIRIRMSNGQFAEMITSLNNGSGTPCTIEAISGKSVEKTEHLQSRKEYVHNAFAQRM